jgi:NMT1-like family
VIVGGVSLEAAPAASQDDAETASIIVNGRKGLYEHGHRGEPAVPVSNATSTWCLEFVLGGKVHVRPERSIFSNALNFCRSAIAALVRSIVAAHRTLPDDLVYGIAEAVFANSDEMMQIHNTAADTVPTNFARNTILPFHDGAARWYHNKSTSGVVHGD